MKRKNVLLTMLLAVSSLSTLTGCFGDNPEDESIDEKKSSEEEQKKVEKEVDKDGRMTLNLRNLYFSEWTGGDTYSTFIEEKFNVGLNVSSYSWADWDSQVNGPINSDNLTDVFHFDLDSYNYANSYEKWIKGDVIKPLPSDLSKWPNVKKVIENTSNISSLYKNGKLYCIPVVKNINETQVEYSPFTYVYRRDWAKQLGVYKTNDEYTWDEFVDLLDAFYTNKCQSGDIVALADVEWGYPSITNFYKDVPHCFAIENNKVVSNYLTSKYEEGLELAKTWTTGTKKYYGYDQYAAKDGDVAKQFYAGRVGVFYENLSLSNYSTLRKTVAKRSEINTKEKLDDATALLKIKGPDGKYALEGTENWFSATFFSADISNAKQEKILDIMDWLLSEEGTEMALYGKKDYDYEKDEDGTITLLEAGWEKDLDGNYIDKLNGAKFLRYMITLGYDTNEKDPLVDQDTLAILNDWYKCMDDASSKGNLRVLKEDASIKWLSTSKKAQYSGKLLEDANSMIIRYCYGTKDKTAYENSFKTSTWTQVLNEINESLGK